MKTSKLLLLKPSPRPWRASATVLASLSLTFAVPAGALEVALDGPHVLRNEFSLKGVVQTLVVDDGVMQFSSPKSALAVAIYKGAEGDLVTESEAIEAEVEFNDGKPSFGVFVRGNQEEAYLLVLNLWGNGAGRLSLLRGPIWPPSQMNLTPIRFVEVPKVEPGEPIMLKVSTTNVDGKVKIETSVRRRGAPDTDLVYLDEDHPLLEPGTVALRFFSGEAEGSVKLNKLSIQPDPHPAP